MQANHTGPSKQRASSRWNEISTERRWRDLKHKRNSIHRCWRWPHAMHGKQCRQPIGGKTGPQLTASKHMEVFILMLLRTEFDQQFGWGWRASQVALVVKIHLTVRNTRDLGSIPGWRVPWNRKWYYTPVFLAWTVMGRGAWDYRPWLQKSRIQLSDLHTFEWVGSKPIPRTSIGESNPAMTLI